MLSLSSGKVSEEMPLNTAYEIIPKTSIGVDSVRSSKEHYLLQMRLVVFIVT